MSNQENIFYEKDVDSTWCKKMKWYFTLVVHTGNSCHESLYIWKLLHVESWIRNRSIIWNIDGSADEQGIDSLV